MQTFSTAARKSRRRPDATGARRAARQKSFSATEVNRRLPRCSGHLLLQLERLACWSGVRVEGRGDSESGRGSRALISAGERLEWECPRGGAQLEARAELHESGAQCVFICK